MPELSPQLRTFIYRIGGAVIALATAYGLIDGNKVALWAGLLAAIVSTGTANIFAPTPAALAKFNDAVVTDTLAKVKTGEIDAEFIDSVNVATPDGELETVVAAPVPVPVADVDPIDPPAVQLVNSSKANDAEHGVNPELVEDGDER